MRIIYLRISYLLLFVASYQFHYYTWTYQFSSWVHVISVGLSVNYAMISPVYGDPSCHPLAHRTNRFSMEIEILRIIDFSVTKLVPSWQIAKNIYTCHDRKL